MASLLKLSGLDWPVLDYSTLFRCQKTLSVQMPYRSLGRPLHFLIDSTGIDVRGAKANGVRASITAFGNALVQAHLAFDEGKED